MAFVPENILEEALAKAVSDPLARPEFYKLLMESELVVLGRATPAGERSELKVSTLRHNGREYLAIFSAPSRLDASVGAGQENFTIAARVFFESTRGANVVLNPNSEYGKTLSAVEIAYWLDPSARARRNLRAADVRLSVPKVPPRKLIDALCILFLNRSHVRAAHLLEAEPLDGREPPHPLVGVAATGNWPKLVAEVSELAAAIAPETILDVTAVDPAAPPDSLSAKLAATPPFYSRTATLN
ncbi:MAG: enhanced serine sensitivity protein SseB C-terminal domain-containing protein [Rhizomicrobium sp.]